MASALRKPIMEVWGAEPPAAGPPAGSRGRALGQLRVGAKPPEAERHSLWAKFGLLSRMKIEIGQTEQVFLLNIYPD